LFVLKIKRRDIAILRTFGSSPWSILAVFVVQGSLIGLLGIAVGVVLGVGIAVNLQSLVHGLESIVGFKFLDARVYFMSDLPAHVRATDVARICGFSFVLACLSTLYPAARAALLMPAESLRND
jgi:lipoprotein-releasing system permease protein